MTEPILLVLGDDLRTRAGAYLFGISRETAEVSVVSGARLGNEFWQLPTDDTLLIERIAREGLHEIGHLLGLSHCLDKSCIMANPLCFDDLDSKQSWFCNACTKKYKRLHPSIYLPQDEGDEHSDAQYIVPKSRPGQIIS
jgi:archaemetzincin